MAAGLEMADIRRVAGREMDPLLLEETVEWERDLDWDFGPAAEAIRGCLNGRELSGCVLLDRGEVVGYGYTAFEDGKGLVGDVYVRPVWRDGINDARLFRVLVEGLLATPGLRRMESQLMLMERGLARSVAEGLGVAVFDRMLMSLNLANSGLRENSGMHLRYRREPWAERHLEGAAGVITLAYDGHVDSRINDQYRSMPGARRFLRNILQFPSCGMFFQGGSFVATDLETGRLAGMILVSLVGPQTGHITQICVVPEARSAGVGPELMRASLAALREAGVKRVSLTVTEANERAIRLYRGIGFAIKRNFCGLAREE